MISKMTKVGCQLHVDNFLNFYVILLTLPCLLSCLFCLAAAGLRSEDMFASAYGGHDIVKQQPAAEAEYVCLRRSFYLLVVLFHCSCCCMMLNNQFVYYSGSMSFSLIFLQELVPLIGYICGSLQCPAARLTPFSCVFIRLYSAITQLVAAKSGFKKLAARRPSG